MSVQVMQLLSAVIAELAVGLEVLLGPAATDTRQPLSLSRQQLNCVCDLIAGLASVCASFEQAFAFCVSVLIENQRVDIPPLLQMAMRVATVFRDYLALLKAAADSHALPPLPPSPISPLAPPTSPQTETPSPLSSAATNSMVIRVTNQQ